jgi:hypothetical protein
MKVACRQRGIPGQSELASIEEDADAVLGLGVTLAGQRHESRERLSVAAHEFSVLDIGSGVLVAPLQETCKA